MDLVVGSVVPLETILAAEVRRRMNPYFDAFRTRKPLLNEVRAARGRAASNDT